MLVTNLVLFWAHARTAVPSLPDDIPPAWAFGATKREADELLALVLSGTKTATSSALQDYVDESLPQAGDLSILLDGNAIPRAVIETTEVAVLPYLEVNDEHARAEGEKERTLSSWREIYEKFWSAHSPLGFSPEMDVVCERFRVVFEA